MRKFLLWPIWILQLATGAKSRLDNPIIGSRRLNRMGLHRMRAATADALCRWRRRRLARDVPSAWLADFERDGFVVIRDVIPSGEFPEIARAVLSYEGEAREMQQGDAITRRMAIDPAMLATIPGLKRLLRRPDIVALFNYVASYRTTPLHYVQTIVSRAGSNDPDPQEAVHADSFHSSLKSWLFLRPVALEDGPFCFVRGSHRMTPQRLAWEQRRSLTDPRAIDRLSARGSPRVSAQDLREMGLPPPEALALPANCLVVADTVGFHARGSSAKPGERVELWSYARRNPFLPWLGGDILSLPGIAERRVGWLWAFRDRFSSLIGQPWRPVGRRTAITAEPEGAKLEG